MKDPSPQGRRPVLLHIFPTFDKGGTELRVTRILNALPFPAHHIIMAINGGCSAAERIESHVSFTLAPSPGKRSLGPFLLWMRRYLTQSRPDLVLTYNWGSIEAVLGARLFTNCPIIHNESGFGSEEAVQRKRRRKMIRRCLLRGIGAIVVNSTTLQRIAYEEFKLPSQKVRLIRNGVDLDRYKPGRDHLTRIDLGVTEDTILFGSVGNHRPEKNLPLLVEAFASAKLSKAKLVLVGNGPIHLSVRKLIEELGASARIVLAGEVRDPLKFYQAFDVFVLSSATEQTPNALLEAMACGLPAISTDVGDIRAILGEDKPPVIVKSNDLMGMRAAIERLSVDMDLRLQLGRRNTARCAEYFSLDRMVHEFANLYQSSIYGTHP